MSGKTRVINRLPKAVREIISAYRQSRNNKNYKRIATLPIQRSGLSEDGIPFVKLENGVGFYGYLPTKTQQYIYRYFCRFLKSRLDEAAIGVAYDIVQRYLGPESRNGEIGLGKYYDFVEGDTVIEIGAYIGYYAMRAAELVGESGQVVAIEAIDENIEILKKNIELNSFRNITIVPKAAWNSTGSLKLFRHSQQRASINQSIVQSEKEITVPCDKVDNILDNLGIHLVDFVRIQVNGAEWEVLDGMTKTLSKGPIVLVAAPYTLNGAPSWQRIETFLQDEGYITKVDRGNVFAKRPKKDYGETVDVY